MPDLLAAVVRATTSAPDSAALLARVAGLLAARVDWVVADRLDPPDLITRVAALGPGGLLRLPAGLGAVEPGGSTARRSSAGSAGMLPALERTPHSLLRLDAATLQHLAASPDAHAALQASTALSLGTGELLLLGLRAREVLLGVLTVGRVRPFDDDELAELLDVAAHVGTALDAARLHAVQHEVATAMQTSLLPPVPGVAGLRLAARYSPASHGLAVGGDWYDAFPSQGGLVVVVGDVRGHDLPAAARMADLRNLLRALAVDRDEPPSALLSRLERTAASLGVEADATCVVGRMTRTGGGWELLWTSAGHPPPVLLSAGRARLLEPDPDLMLGVDQHASRTDHLQQLASGDVLVLYTDGLVEQRDVALTDRLEQLRALVESSGATTSPDQLAETLLAALGAGSADDVALLVVRVR